MPNLTSLLGIKVPIWVVALVVALAVWKNSVTTAMFEDTSSKLATCSENLITSRLNEARLKEALETQRAATYKKKLEYDKLVADKSQKLKELEDTIANQSDEVDRLTKEFYSSGANSEESIKWLYEHSDSLQW